MDLKEKVEAKSVMGSLLCRAPQDWVTVDDALALFEEERKALVQERDEARGRCAEIQKEWDKWALLNKGWITERAVLLAREAKLVEALEPFAQIMLPKARDGEHITVCMNVDCFRAARTALRLREEEEATR